ncbi:PLP-dependent aminotransferase family protein [Ochrobactrum cytisi]|nr:PLP-dependent aminotransferase family protein [Brucella cytisi]
MLDSCLPFSPCPRDPDPVCAILQTRDEPYEYSVCIPYGRHQAVGYPQLEYQSRDDFLRWGYPDGDIFPFDAIKTAFDEAIVNSGREALQYSFSVGLPKLRQQIADRMKQEHIHCTMDNILILQGAQQGLDLVARLLIDKGDVIITEAPTFLGALSAFAACEPQYETVPVDDDGLDTDALEALLLRQPNAKLLYTIPDYHNPTGVTMSRSAERP